MSRWSARNARVAFVSVALTVGVGTSVVLAQLTYPALAVVLGTLTGFVVGLAVAVVVRVWPLLRVLWHWSAEMAVLAGLFAAGNTLVVWLGMWPALVAGVLLAGLVAAVSRLRRGFAALQVDDGHRAARFARCGRPGRGRRDSVAIGKPAVFRDAAAPPQSLRHAGGFRSFSRRAPACRAGYPHPSFGLVIPRCASAYRTACFTSRERLQWTCTGHSR